MKTTLGVGDDNFVEIVPAALQGNIHVDGHAYFNKLIQWLKDGSHIHEFNSQNK